MRPVPGHGPRQDGDNPQGDQRPDERLPRGQEGPRRGAA